MGIEIYYIKKFSKNYFCLGFGIIFVILLAGFLFPVSGQFGGQFKISMGLKLDFGVNNPIYREVRFACI